MLCATLGTTACDSFRSEPMPPHHPDEQPPTVRVTARTEGPAYCREGTWTLSVSVEGGTPERVQLITNDEVPTRLEAPYQHVVDCATHAEGRFAFKARVWVDGKHVDAEAVAVTVDRTPPTIVSVRPGHSYPSVASPIAFVFSELLLPESLSSAPTELQNWNNSPVPVPLAHRAVLREGGTVLELVPTSPLQTPVRLGATLLQRNLTDLAGNLLDPRLTDSELMYSAHYMPFRRVAEPLFPEYGGPFVMSFALASDATGPVPVIAFNDFGSHLEQEPHIARWDGHAWQRLPPFRAENERSANILAYQLEARDGVLVFQWRERNAATGATLLQFARYTGTAWERLPVLHIGPSEYQFLTMTLAPQGRPVVAVRRELGGLETEVRVIRWTGTEWKPLGAPLDANPAPQTPAMRVALAADDTRVVVAWEEATHNFDPPHSYIHVRTFENGIQGPAGLPISVRTNTSVDSITLAIQPDHRALIAWMENGAIWHSEHGDIYSAEALRFSSAALDSAQPNWVPPEDINLGHSIGRSASLRLVVGNDLEPWLVWNEHGPYGYYTQAYFSRRRPTGWEPKQVIGWEFLHGFHLDEDGTPWALSGDAVLRPQ
ncbi:hypothetical protein BHS06_25560 [Myxococcus xanthus]|nr:hypothetical protein BHS06_25560 [Myxococcus xanthus]